MCFAAIAKRLQPLNSYSHRVFLPIVLLGARLLVANDFWKSGNTKLAYVLEGRADNLYFLFEDYHVPVLSVKAAAWMGMTGELGLSILLALGLFGRFGALGLMFMCAVIYHADQNELAPFWAMICALIVVQGPGRYSVDRLLWSSGPVTGKTQ